MFNNFDFETVVQLAAAKNAVMASNPRRRFLDTVLQRQLWQSLRDHLFLSTGFAVRDEVVEAPTESSSPVVTSPTLVSTPCTTTPNTLQTTTHTPATTHQEYTTSNATPFPSLSEEIAALTTSYDHDTLNTPLAFAVNTDHVPMDLDGSSDHHDVPLQENTVLLSQDATPENTGVKRAESACGGGRPRKRLSLSGAEDTTTIVDVDAVCDGHAYEANTITNTNTNGTNGINGGLLHDVWVDWADPATDTATDTASAASVVSDTPSVFDTSSRAEPPATIGGYDALPATCGAHQLFGSRLITGVPFEKIILNY